MSALLSHCQPRRYCGPAVKNPRRLGICGAAATDRAQMKAELLEAAERVQRGLTATDEEKARIDSMAQALEAVNPNPKSLAAKEINGQWKLVYTTSEGILGTKKPPFLRPSGPIYQIIGSDKGNPQSTIPVSTPNIGPLKTLYRNLRPRQITLPDPTNIFKRPNDAENLKARNNESWPLYNSVTANLTPVNDSLVNVQFQQFKLGNIIPITAPPSAKGSLDTTYVDDELRISRGDKGNLFVLSMEDPTVRLG